MTFTGPSHLLPVGMGISSQVL